MGVELPSKILDIDFDYILLAAISERHRESMVKDLVEMGISQEKIIHIRLFDY